MILTITKENINSLIENPEKPAVIDVFATWCGPCMMMKPHFEELAEELGNKYTFAQLNIDEARELAIQFSVTSVPTLIFIKNKSIVGREVGYMSKADLSKRIQNYLD